MSQFSDISNLRKAGKLDEAHHKAADWLESDPENIWSKRAMAWVIHDFLKKNAETNDYPTFFNYLRELLELELAEEEKMVFDSCAWQIGKVVYSISKSEPIDYSKLDELFTLVQRLHITKPSNQYTFIFKAFHKAHQDWHRYLEFADWWNFSYFQGDDHQQTEYNDRKIMSTSEQAFIAYSKKLLSGDLIDPFQNRRVINKEKIKSFIPVLNQHITKHPNQQYPPYYLVKLLLAIDEKEGALSGFIPFAKKKRSEFWVWGLLAEIKKDDADLYMACLCKALSLRAGEDFLVKIRKRLARHLIVQGHLSEAKTEIEKLRKTKESHGWKIDQEVVNWTKEEWYTKTEGLNSNSVLYNQHTQKAEALLYSDLPEEYAVVEYVNNDKKILNFIINKSKRGFFNYSKVLRDPQIGDLIKVRFEKSEGNFHKVLTAEKEKEKKDHLALKDFSGPLKMAESRKFGFVENIFIQPSLINTNNLKDGDHIQGKAILSFNKKKNDWGWKAIILIRSVDEI